MEHTKLKPDSLPDYRVRARNTSADSENRIHDDEVAARYGFRGGLVPGVTLYGYMTVPLVERFGLDWLSRGAMQIRFQKPVYEGDEVILRGEIDKGSDALRVTLRAERDGGEVCATAVANIGGESPFASELCIENYSAVPLPSLEERPVATREVFVPGADIGTLTERLNLPDAAFLAQIDERLPIYAGDEAVGHPAYLLGLMNQALVRNFRLGPWIHVASELVNHSVARDGEVILVRGRIRECFERKGHEFVVLDFLVLSEDGRAVQQVRHTAIYRPKFV